MDNNQAPQIAVLFVDDEEIIRKSSVRELMLQGFSVTAAASGSEAIEALQEKQYDVLITDLMMTGIDGLTVLKAAKTLAPLTSVIILTGYGDMHSAIDALRLGADDFTLKPCEIEELVFRIRRCLEKRSLLQLLLTQKHQLEVEIERRRVIEEQLRESDKRYRLALDASSNGVWDRNLQTDEIYFGENWYRNLGYTGATENSREQTFQNLLHPDDRERVLTLRDNYVRGTVPRYETEYRLRNKSGGWNWILSRGQAVERDANGNALRIIGTVTDITRLKEVESDLIRAHSEMEQRVQERTTELYESNIALKVLLKKRNQDRKDLADQVLSNTSKLVAPYLDKLLTSKLSEQQEVLVEILRNNIKELTSPFANNLSSKLVQLTPAEIQVANLVKLGKSTKEIAEIMHLAPGTISIYRKKIRKKLNLTHQKTNLQSMLSMNP